ncbi:MAG: CRISPR-associated endoribonuclease Cas6 [Brumimicrobium sp.]
MRLHLKTNPNNEPVPFDHLKYLVGTLHKWIGANTIHGDISLYSFSWLRGATVKNGALSFPKGASWFISSYDNQLLKKVIETVTNSPKIRFGLDVNKVHLQENPVFKTEHKFLLGSPALVKSNEGERIRHYLFNEDRTDFILTQTLKSKMKKAGFDEKDVSVSFDKNYHKPRTKLVDYNGIKNRANYCPVIIKGDPDAISFAWDVGVGNSTGIGFGSLN